MPVVSTIIPVYNGEATLASTLESVFAQTLADQEVIVVNDGSTDGTGALLAAIADPRLVVLDRPNGGQARARNEGIAIARGEFVAFLDADDWWTPDKLADQVAALRDRPEAGLAYSWTELVDDPPPETLREGRESLGRGVRYSPEDFWHDRLLVTDFISSGSNPLVRRSLLEKVGGFDPDLTPAEDWDLWLRLAAAAAVASVPKVQVLYRQRPTSSSENVWKQEAASLKIMEKGIARDRDRLERHRKAIYGNRYKYLAFKALDGPPDRRRAATAVRFLARVVRCDRGVLKQWRTMLALAAKLAIVLALPRSWAAGAIARSATLQEANRQLLAFTRMPRFD